MDAASRVIHILRILKILNLHEQRQELIKAFDEIDIDVEKSLDCLVTLSVPVHGNVVDWVPTAHAVLLGEDLTVTGNDVARVLLEQADEAQIKLAMPLDRVCVVLHRLDELTLFNVHGFHSETALFLLELVVHDLLEAHALEAEHRIEALVFAPVRQDVVRVPTIVVDVQLVEDHI